MEDGRLYFMDRIWVPLAGGVRAIIMDEAHTMRYSSGYDTIWVTIDRLTKSAHFLTIREYYKMDKLARLYIDEIVARHGVSLSIISNHDGRFTSWFWQTLQKALGTRLDIIITLVFDVHHLRHYMEGTPVLWAEIRESRLIGPEMVQETTDKVVQIKERLKSTRDCQKSYVDNKRKPLEFSVGDQVLLKVSPWKGIVRFSKKGKLAQSVHDTFHVSNLKKCLADANLHVPLEEIKVDKTLRFVEEPVKIMD
ncbi:putative reverse transcriptase domain-containing protein [Tanacetum coccineum]